MLLFLVVTAVGVGAYFQGGGRERLGLIREWVGTSVGGASVTTIAAIRDSGEALVGRHVSLGEITIALVPGDRTFLIRDTAGATLVALLGARPEGEPSDTGLRFREGQQFAVDGIVRQGGSAAAATLAEADAQAVTGAPVYLEVTGVLP